MRDTCPRSLLLFLAALLLAATPARAVEGSVTPFVGMRFGGEFEIEGSARTETLDPAPSFGLFVEFGVFRSGNLQILLAHQESDLETEDLLGEPIAFDFVVDTVHVGTTYEWGPENAPRYVGVTLGATHYDAKGVSQEDSLGFSASLGGGVKLLWGRRLGWRFDARGYVTFLADEAGAACGGGSCAVGFSGDGWGQLEVSTGLVLRFGVPPPP